MAIVGELQEAAPVSREHAGAPVGDVADRPHVCMIAYTFYPFDARVRREAETLASQGYRVRCLTTKTAKSKATSTVLEGVEVRELGVPKYRGKNKLAYIASYVAFLCAASISCLGYVLKDELDVVHAHNLPDFLVLAGLIPRALGRKVILDVHDSIPETFSTKFSGTSLLWKALCLEERLSAAVAHRVICVNEPQRAALVDRGVPVSKTFVSMNVPDPRIFERQPVTQPAGGEAFRLVYHGTMVDRLGVDLVIRAVARLRERVPGIHLHLWGNGDDLARFQALAHELAVNDRVEFRPQGYPLEALPDQLRMMDVGVVGNRRSTAADLMLPVKLLEYVALQIPAVVPRLRTIEHYFSDDMVTYFEPENVDSLSEAICRLWADAERRRQQRVRASQFLARHGWEQQGPQLVTMYRELVGKRGT